MFERIVSYCKRKPLVVFRRVFLFLLASDLFMIVYRIVRYAPSYADWSLSNWMINYEGGFVRRGLAGELLYLLYGWAPYPVHMAVLGIMLATFLLAMYLLYRLFRREGWSYLLLLSPLLLVPNMAHTSFWTRCDFLSLLLSVGIFACYFRYFRRRDWKALAGMQLLSMTTVLLHEASFFYTFPILFVHYVMMTHRGGGSWLKTLAKGVLLWMPAGVSMAAVCIFKGNEKVVQAIWASWQPCMEAFPLGSGTEGMGESIKALAWNTTDTALHHLQRNYLHSFLGPIPSIPFTLYNFVAIYYLVTRLNTVDMGWNTLKSVDSVRLSNVLLLQFLFMLPMFTVLSCDWGRTIPYTVFTTLFAYHYMKGDKGAFPSRLTSASRYLQAKIDGRRLLGNPWTYWTVLLTLPVPAVGAPNWHSPFIFKFFYTFYAIIVKGQ